jgi:Fic family protein
MQLSDFGATKPGRLIQPSPDFWAFVPAPLAPRLTLGVDLINRLVRADRALGRLAGVTETLRGADHLIGPFMRREALHSTRIDGLDSTLAALALAEETTSRARGAVEQVVVSRVETHRAALAFGRTPDTDRRFLLGLHRRLFADVPGVVGVGRFRDRQIWFGPRGCSRTEAVFVPPPTDEMDRALDALARYSREPTELPYLLRLALMHYQLEAIQPFLMGTGAVNRLLLSLHLSTRSGLPGVPLATSAYFSSRRVEYRARLQAVTRYGEWEAWLRFFLDGVAEQADDCGTRIAALLALHGDYLTRLRRARQRQIVYRLVDGAFERTAISVHGAARILRREPAEIAEHLSKLVEIGILTPAGGSGSPRAYIAQDVLQVLEGPRPATAPTVAALRAIEAQPLPNRLAVDRPAAPGGSGKEGLDGESPHLLDEPTRLVVLELLRDIEAATEHARQRPSLVA